MEENKFTSKELEESILTIWAEVLNSDSIDVEDNFFDVGGSSIMAIKIISKIKGEFDLQITIANFFQYPTIRKCSQFLTGEVVLTKRPQKKVRDHRQVAIVGMSGKFPGANDINEYWDMIINNKEGITFFKDDELDQSVPLSDIKNPDYIKARGYLPNIDLFDYTFFGMNPRTGELMDPQIRLMLEYSKRALDHSGNSVTKTEAKVGVFAGMSHNTYFRNNILNYPDKIKSIGAWTVDTLNEKDYVATQVAYKLGCTGPAISMHTACSTSLVAIIQAVKSIQAGDCDMALAGGVNVEAISKAGYLYQTANIRSKDGHCKPFDKDSSGTIFCDGVGVVVLKDLELAKKENDHIYAVISGVGINNDGNDKVSLSAPSVNGQKDVIEMALVDGDIDPTSIELFEAHGTATPVGDPIEVEAIVQAWNVKNHRAVLGSVKGNIGHTISAAGVAGFIKGVLSVENSILPPTKHFNSANPELRLHETPFTILKEKQYWESSLRRAAISAFGVGGTNAHVIIENYNEESVVHPKAEGYLPFPISAKSKESLENYTKTLIEYIKESEISLQNISYTLCQGREDFKHRVLVFAKTRVQLLEELKKQIPKEVNKAELLFAFPGQGAQYLGMGHSLYNEFDKYREIVDYCCEYLKKPLNIDLREILFFRKDEEALKNTFYTQPAIFVTEYALAMLLGSFGVKAKTFVGHSVGEFAAAVLSNVMSVDDALSMISKRSQLMKDLPGGSMLSVRLDEVSIKEYLSKDIQLAAVNGPTLMVVAGPDSAVDKLKSILDTKNIQARKLHTSHAFHSDMMNDVVPIYEEYVKTFKLKSPDKKIYSTLLNKWIDHEMADPSYWAKHIAMPVLFRNAIDHLSSEAKNYTLIELGPRNTLVTLARMQLRENKKKWNCLNLLTDKPGDIEISHFYSQLGQLWEVGHLDIGQFHQMGNKEILPEYSFDYRSLWLDSIVVKKDIEPQLPIQRQTMEATITKELMTIIEDTSGFSESELDNNQTFIALGFDSLLLTQVSLIISKHFDCPLSFRQLMDDVSTITKLASYVKASGNQDTIRNLMKTVDVAPQAIQNPQTAQTMQPMAPVNYISTPVTTVSTGNAVQDIINKQLEIMSQQVQMLSGQPISGPSMVAQSPVINNHNENSNDKAKEEISNIKLTVNTSGTAFGAQARISTVKEAVDSQVESKINNFIEKYAKKTIKSKNFTQKYRSINSDPRVVSGFRPETKEIIYSIVVNKSKAQHLWDLDGNEYVDMTCGFGSNFFGNRHPRITAALHDQLDSGIEIGPQHELVGECAELICEFTGLSRAAFCNTGSEAVLGAIRAARAISGKTKVIMFTGSYHGINDEVIVRGLKDGRAMPAAAGISKEAVKDVLVLEYGTDETLKRIEKEIEKGNIACVISETVQSRRPGFRPKEFLKKVREITEQNDVAFIFDEVITGFRNCAGGAQEYFGIKADLATYGKIVGAGMSIGVIAGSEKYMDVLDGGFWQYGDDSTPTVGVTYFAGTFVRHPLALRAMREALLILKEAGPAFYKKLNEDSDKFVQEVNSFCELSGAPIKFEYFGGMLKSSYTNSEKNNDLFFACMRHNGVHIWDGFPWYITMAHTEEDLKFVINTFKKSVRDMQEMGIFPSLDNSKSNKDHFLVPPMDGARLGKDENGNPAWFVEDRDNPGEFLIIEKE